MPRSDPSAAVGRRNHAATRPTSFATSSRRSHTQLATVDHMFDSGDVRPCGRIFPRPGESVKLRGACQPRQPAEVNGLTPGRGTGR